ncbi:dihydroxyacetone kinase subunit L [Natronosporangium hydrolyticum]|uniref:Dihydroxyacetone kinase subunit L n=1 Tax=Natronosporangium hydrolyticum TaxID=2811111 RepID=A0A895YAX3_9ACTN|nr:dihydroxyacetone kinase subunit DhaL [Natronosporangium hydrolyticum]QSB13392.1 dihydroxyacetone kinase subunit L [Natronosporangium hydrolyticum]
MSSDITVSDLTGWLTEFGRLIKAHKEELTALDAAIGDADHGTNMDRGMTAVAEALAADPPQTPAGLGKQVGMTLVSKVGGASGPLFGTFFLRLGAALGEATEVTPDQFAAGLSAGLAGVVARGKAEPGDKTMVDALTPAVAALESAVGQDQPLADGLAAAAQAAADGRDATVPMLARKGRASYLGERSIGHQDPGATTVALLLAAAATAMS